MLHALSQSELFGLLATGDTVVLPHAQASRTVRARYSRQLPAVPASSDPSPALDWRQWTQHLWSTLLLDGREERLLLNRLQEDQLWAEIIGDPQTGDVLVAPTAPELIEMARSGFRLAASYQALGRLRSTADSPDTRTFALWADAFRELCNRRRLVSPALLDSTLAGHLRSGALRIPEPVHLVGFDAMTPGQHDLVSALRAGGSSVRQWELRLQPAASPNLAITAPDPATELRSAVRFIREAARSHPAGQAPTFALVTPNPAEQRTALERLFRELLAPELEAVTTDLSSTPWQFSAEPPLYSATLIAHALDVLHWIDHPHPVERLSQLLYSPYFTFSETPTARAHFEAKVLRNSRLLRPEFTLGEFSSIAARGHAGLEAAQFPEFQALARSLNGRDLRQGSRTHGEWADQVRALLAAVGWPGPRTLSPAEFGALQAWEHLLDLLSTLDATSRRLPLARFLDKLERESRQTSLPHLTPDAPIQVLSLSESDATFFDFGFIVGATDAKLLIPEKLHPLLPRHLQSSLGMPGADPARILAKTRDRLGSLRNRCSSLHLLAPAADETGPLRYSPLAAELGFEPRRIDDLLPPTPYPDPTPLDEVPQTARLPSLPSPEVTGGARVLELQAACGFRAFATFRLQAEELAPGSLGLDFREAGTRLHKAMEFLWGELKDQATLKALSETGRKAAVARAVEVTLGPLRKAPGSESAWTQAFLGVLEYRFKRLLERWLDLELKRAPFTTAAKEQEQVVAIGPLRLTVRPDRVDTIEGGFAYIDYKTTYDLRTDQWLGPRPELPQLPLYALLALPGELRAIAFARVRWDQKIGWLSLADDPDAFLSRSEQHDLQDELERWRTELALLAQAFADGGAEVNPRSYPKTCQYCAHRLLCRLDPETLLESGTDDDEDEDRLGDLEELSA